MGNPTPVDKTPTTVKYIADGNISEFSFSFIIFSEEDIEIYFNGEIQSGGYSVTKYENSTGGYIKFDTPPAKNTLLTIYRNLTIKRTTSFSESKAFRAKMLNYELDYQVACLEQLIDGIKRTISLPVNSNDANATLPYPQAGRAIVWDDDGTSLTNSKIDIGNLDNIYTQVETTLTECKELKNIVTAEVENILEYITDARSFLALLEEKADKTLNNVENSIIKSKAENRKYVIDNIAMASVQITAYLEVPDEILASDNVRIFFDVICDSASNGYSPGEALNSLTALHSDGWSSGYWCHPKVQINNEMIELFHPVDYFCAYKNNPYFNKVDKNKHHIRLTIFY